MLARFRPRLSYANVVATMALFLVLGGGAYAAVTLPKNSVGPKQIKKNAVSSKKVKNGSLKAADFGSGQIPKGPKGPKGATGVPCLASEPGCRGPKGNPCLASDPNCRGPKGDAGPGIRWALVKGTDGSVLEQSGGITAVRQATGVYYVDFGSAVTGHPISATVHAPPGNVAGVTGAIPCSGTLVPLEPDTFTCAAHNTVGEVAVGTANIGTGSPTDQDFYIEVFQ
jgi:hypothetical protein